MFTRPRRPETSSSETAATDLPRLVYEHLLENDLDTARVEVDLERRYHPDNPQLEEVARFLEGAREQAVARSVLHLCNAALLQEVQDLEDNDRTRRAQSIRNHYGPALLAFQEEAASGRMPVREAWNRLLSSQPGIQEYLHQHELMPRIEALLRPETTALQADQTVLDVAYGARIRTESFAAARYLYLSLSDSRHFGAHAREVLASLDGEERSHRMANSVVGVLETVIPLAPVLADSNRTVLKNLSMIMGFRTAGAIGSGFRELAMPVIRGLTRSQTLRNAAGFLVSAGANAASMPLLNGGLSPLRNGTYVREFAHNFALQTFLGPVGSVFRTPIAGRLAAVGGMAAFDVLTDPTSRQISPWLLLANAAANDLQGRAGHFEGREDLNPRTIDVRGAVDRGLDRMARAVLPWGAPLLSIAVGVPEATRIARRSPQRAAGEPPPPEPPSPRARPFLAPFVSMEVETLQGPTDGRPSPDHIPLSLQVRNHGEGRPRRGFGPDVRTLRFRVGNEADRARLLDIARRQAEGGGLAFEPMEPVAANRVADPQFAVRSRDGRLLYIGRIAVGELRTARPSEAAPQPIPQEIQRPAAFDGVGRVLLEGLDTTLRPSEDATQGLVLDAAFTGMPHEYLSRGVRVADGRVVPLQSAPRARLIERLDTDIASEGSTAGVFRAEMSIDGVRREVAVKVFKNPQPHPTDGTVPWEHAFHYAERELANLGILADLGLGPRPFGMVRVGGNFAIAMERVEGRAIDEMTPAEANRFVSERTFGQLGSMWRRLLNSGHEICDFQFAVLTRDQIINGTRRRAGDVVFWDAGGLRPLGEARAEAARGGFTYQPPTAADVVARARQAVETVRQRPENRISASLPADDTLVDTMLIEPSSLPPHVRRNRRDFMRAQMVRVRTLVNEEGYGRVRSSDEKILWLHFQALVVDDVEAGEHATPENDPLPARLEAARGLAEHFGVARNESFLRGIFEIVERNVRQGQHGFD